MPEKENSDQKSDGDAKSQASIVSELSNFISQIEALNTSLPLLMRTMEEVRRNSLKDYENFLLTNGKVVESAEKKTTYNIDFKHVPELGRRGRTLNRLQVGGKILPRSFVVSLVSQFDFFIGRLLRVLYELRPELLNASDRQITFAELQQFDSIISAREYVLEKEVETLLRKSHTEQFDWLESKFSVPLRKELPIWSTFVEVTQRRNLFVHCNGKVSTQYLDVCRSNSVRFERLPALGEELGVTPKYYSLAYTCIFEIAVKLTHVLWRKTLPTDLATADSNLVAITYDLLQQEQYALAIALLDFAVDTLKRLSNDAYRLTFLINRAQAYKWVGDTQRCKALISQQDWSACDQKYQLAVAVLNDDFTAAAKCMRRIGTHGEIEKHDYTEWPLFKEFRKTDEFRAVYDDVFGESFQTVQNTEKPIRTDSSEEENTASSELKPGHVEELV